MVIEIMDNGFFVFMSKVHSLYVTPLMNNGEHKSLNYLISYFTCFLVCISLDLSLQFRTFCLGAYVDSRESASSHPDIFVTVNFLQTFFLVDKSI